MIVRQKKRVCHQILPFNSKSKFKLTQYNLNPTPRDTASITCICANKLNCSGTSHNSCTRSRSGSATSNSSQFETPRLDAVKQTLEQEQSSPWIRDTRAESNGSYESLMVDSSYRSIRAHSVLLNCTSDDSPEGQQADNISRTSVQSLDNISTQSLMFTPEPLDTPITSELYRNQSVPEPLVSDKIPVDTDNDVGVDGELLDQPIEVGNSMFYRNNSIEVGNSVFYRRSPSSQSLTDSQSAASVSTISPSGSLREFHSDLTLSIQPSDSVSLINQAPPTDSLRIAIPYSTENCPSPNYSREEPPPFDSDEDTISVASGELPPNFMFDDMFCNRGAGVGQLVPEEDTPSLKVKKFLSIYANEDEPSQPMQNEPIPPPPPSFLNSNETTSVHCINPNQSDDEKLRNLNRSGGTTSNNTSISLEEDAFSDSSLEDTDPYLVVDIQSLPSQSPAPQLLESLTQPDGPGLYQGEEGGVEEEDDCDEIRTGWVITHTLEEVKMLYLNLRGCKSAGYPSSFPVPLPKDSSQLRESMEHTSDFLNFVLRDKTLSQSEHVYR